LFSIYCNLTKLFEVLLTTEAINILKRIAINKAVYSTITNYCKIFAYIYPYSSDGIAVFRSRIGTGAARSRIIVLAVQ
jgi:hypothetical protein